MKINVSTHAVSHLEKAETVPGLLEYSRFVSLHQSGQESCKDTQEEKHEEKAYHFTH